MRSAGLCKDLLMQYEMHHALSLSGLPFPPGALLGLPERVLALNLRP